MAELGVSNASPRSCKRACSALKATYDTDFRVAIHLWPQPRTSHFHRILGLRSATPQALSLPAFSRRTSTIKPLSQCHSVLGPPPHRTGYGDRCVSADLEVLTMSAGRHGKKLATDRAEQSAKFSVKVGRLEPNLSSALCFAVRVGGRPSAKQSAQQRSKEGK